MSMLNKKLLAAGIAAGSLLLWGCQERGPGTGQTADYQFQQQEGTGGSGEEGMTAEPETAPPQSSTMQGTGGSGETGLNTEEEVSGTGPESAEQPNPDGLGDTSGTADTTMDNSLPSGQGSGEVEPGGLGGTGTNTQNETGERVTDPRMEPGAEIEPGTGGAGAEFEDADGVSGTTGEDTGTPGTQSQTGQQQP